MSARAIIELIETQGAEVGFRRAREQTPNTVSLIMTTPGRPECNVRLEMRYSILLPERMEATVHFLNMTGRRPVPGRIAMEVRGDAHDTDVWNGALGVMLRALEVHRDCLDGNGVASAAGLKAPANRPRGELIDLG